MDLPNLRELKSILKLCRAQGVTDITLGAVAIKFGDLPKTKEELEAEESDVMQTIAPSDDELAYWSAQPDPLDGRETAEQ